MSKASETNYSQTPLCIDAFPEGGGIWRVDWFGPIAFPDRMSRRTQPSVLVYLSKVVKNNFWDDASVLLNPEATMSADKQVSTWISVGTSMLLGIGDIWQSKTRVLVPDYEFETFSDIEINQDSSRLVKAGLGLENDEGFLLPLAEHPWHLGNTQSYCVRIDLPDGRLIVVPCMELIRFYFGSSSTLLSKLFKPTLDLEDLCSHSSWTRAGNKLTLELAKGMPKASAADVGRLVASQTAWRAAIRVSSSCLAASIAGRDIYPQTYFPFEGKTTLQAIGKWLSRGSQPRQTFLVYQLKSCAHPFPFGALRFTVQDAKPKKKYQDGSITEQPQGVARAKGRASSAVSSTDPTLMERDASSRLASREHRVSIRRHFVDLLGKPVWSMKRLDAQAPPAVTQNSSINSWAVGEAGSVQKVRSVALVDALQNELLAPSFLKVVLNSLKGVDGLQVSMLTAGLENDWCLPLELLLDQDGALATELLMKDKYGLRPRRISAFMLENGDLHFLLCILEGRFVAPFLYKLEAHGFDGVWQRLRCTAQDFVAMMRSKAGQEIWLGPRNILDTSTKRFQGWLWNELAKYRASIDVSG